MKANVIIHRFVQFLVCLTLMFSAHRECHSCETPEKNCETDAIPKDIWKVRDVLRSDIDKLTLIHRQAINSIELRSWSPSREYDLALIDLYLSHAKMKLLLCVRNDDPTEISQFQRQQDSATVKKILFECADRLDQRSDEMFQAGILMPNDLKEMNVLTQKIKLEAVEFAKINNTSSPDTYIETDNDSKAPDEIEMILNNQVEKAKALLDLIRVKTDSGKIPRIDYDLILLQINYDRAQLELLTWKFDHSINTVSKAEFDKLIHDKYEELSDATEQFAKCAERMHNVGVIPLRELIKAELMPGLVQIEKMKWQNKCEREKSDTN